MAQIGPVQQARTLEARASLIKNGLLGGTPAADIPETIVRSWRRSLANAVPSDSRMAIRYVNRVDPDSLLMRAATPVIDRLENDLSGVEVAMVLSDESGQIILRRTRDRGQAQRLDRASAARGFDYSELSIGTNGLGTVIEEQRPVFVRGAEHYAEFLEDISCAGVPIKNPFSGRVLGAFSFACPVSITNPLMGALIVDAGRQIESRLLELASAGEQFLMQVYAAKSRRHRGPVIVLSRQTILANALGLAYISSETHAQLWEALSGHSWSALPEPMSLRLPGGVVTCVAECVGGGGPSACFSLEIIPAHSANRFGISIPAPTDVIAHRLGYVEDQLRQAHALGEVLAVTGPPGSGKLHTLEDFLDRHRPGQDRLVLDVSTFGLESQRDWFAAAATALETGRIVILRHVQDLAEADVNKVGHLVAQATQSQGSTRPSAALSPLLALTGSTGATPAHVTALIDSVATTIELPALTAISAEIPQYVRAIVAGFAEPLRGTTLSSPAMQALIRWKWAGNLTELKRTLLGLARRTDGGLVQLSDLPGQLVESAHSRQLMPIESAERDAIITALRRTRGNRSACAATLGIGRTTLYRKLHLYHIDDAEILDD